MKYKDLINVTNKPRVTNSTELYDITLLNFVYKNDILANNAIEHIVDKDEEMRMDLVCESIYGNTDHIDFLMNINNIKNPLMVYDGMEIIYVNPELIASFVPEATDNITIRSKISNKRKKTKTDPNRKTFLEEKSTKSLPPTVTKRDYNPIKYRDGKIRIGEDIFKV